MPPLLSPAVFPPAHGSRARVCGPESAQMTLGLDEKRGCVCMYLGTRSTTTWAVSSGSQPHKCNVTVVDLIVQPAST